MSGAERARTGAAATAYTTSSAIAPASRAVLLAATPAALDAVAAGGAFARFLPVRHVSGLRGIAIEFHGRIGEPPALPRLHGGAAADEHERENGGDGRKTA